MRRNYDVYIGGRPIRFLDEAEEAISDGRPIRTISTLGALELALAELVSTEVRGLQLRSTMGFDAWSHFEGMHRFVLAAGGVVMDEGGRLLAIRRLGVWDLPKGKVETKEVVEDAAVREVQEECGLEEVHLVRWLTATWHTYERKGKAHLKRTEWFLMRSSSKEKLSAQSEEGIEEVRWLSAEEVRMMETDTYPSLLPVLAAWRALSR
jgi:ADP-ribose pyrophosphatase YjhB (NUDIX family)